MAAAGPAAGVASLASIGLSAFGDVEKGKGQAAADDMRAAQLEEAAKFGRIQATLTDTTLRERLNTTLGHIDAIQATGNVDPSSPTTGAIEDFNRMVSDRQRTSAVVSQRSQAATDEASANYMRQAGQFSTSMGYLSAFTDVAGGIAKGMGPGGPLRAG